MIRKALLTLGVIFNIGFCYSQTANEVLNKTMASLNSLKTVEYSNYFYQFNKGIESLDSSKCYLDFTSKDTLFGARYHLFSYLGTEKFETVFDGSRHFSTDWTRKFVIFKNNPGKSMISNAYSLVFSYYFWKKTLPKIASDTTITISKQNDTIVNNIPCYQLHVSVTGRFIDILTGDLMPMGNEAKANYFISISKDNNLPVMAKYVFPGNEGGYSKTTFKNINLQAEKNEDIWSYERFPADFTRISRDEYFSKAYREKNSKLMLNTSAPEWSLPMIDGDSVRLSTLKGKPVLIEFWFPYCGGCVEAISDINTITEKYRKKGLAVFGIEYTKDEGKGLKEYIDKNKIRYPNLYNGRNVAKDLKISAAPTFVLIDKNGKIVYIQAGLDKKELVKAINKSL